MITIENLIKEIDEKKELEDAIMNDDLKFDIVEEEDLVSVFYNGEQVDYCEIIREEI